MTDLTSLIPDLESMDAGRLQAVSARITSLLRDQFPDIDVTPGSVFADNVLRPVVYMVAGFEQAADCVLGDLDLDNILQGTVCDCDRVESLLRLVGVDAGKDEPATGVVRLEYSTDTLKTVPNSARFVFNNETVFRPITSLQASLLILPSGGGWPSPENNVYRLSRTPAGSFIVDVPVYGPAGASLVSNGASGTTDISDTTLVSVSLPVPVVPSRTAPTIVESALAAQRTFASAALTTRSSAISFFFTKLHNLAGVSVVMPGDAEMRRGNSNLFGVPRTGIDIFPKGKTIVTRATSTITVTHDSVNGRWVGLLSTPHVPLRLRGFTSEAGVSLTPQKLVSAVSPAASADFPGLSGAFSHNEIIGVQFAEADGASITRGNSPSAVSSDGTVVSVSGSYLGSLFNASERVSLRVSRLDTNDFEVHNVVTDERVSGVTATANGGGGLSLDLTGDAALERWASGLSIDWVDASYTGAGATISATAEYGRVSVSYDYDPLLIVASRLALADTNKGPFSVGVMAPRPCTVDALRVYYRTQYGKWVDTGKALDAIMDYVNQSVHPDTLEDARISDALFFAGASGVTRIEKEVTLFATLADELSENGRDPVLSGTPPKSLIKSVNVADAGPLDTLAYDLNALHSYVGPRNTQYLLDRDAIQLVEQRN